MVALSAFHFQVLLVDDLSILLNQYHHQRRKNEPNIESVHVPVAPFRSPEEASDIISHDRTHEVSTADQDARAMSESI